MSRALKFLSIAIFILACVPRANISVGPVPIYLIDVCLLGAIFYGGLNRIAHYGKVPLGRWIIAILGFALFSEAVSGIFSGAYIESAYMAGRMCLAVSLFFLLNNLICSEDDLVPILKAATAGMLITALLMAMTSLPGTRGMVAWLFSYDFLSPVGEGFFVRTSDLERGTRGQSLVGYNIISSWFVCLLWPMAMALFRSPSATGIWKYLSLAGIVLGPFGVIFSYSRGALLGLLLLIIALLIFGEGKLKAHIMLAVMIVMGVISWFGWDSQHFYFERIERRTKAVLENPYESNMERERFASYSDAFAAVSENPALMIGGTGLGIGRASRRGYEVEEDGFFAVTTLGNVADHSVFTKATLTYGMLAAFCYLAVWFGALYKCFFEARYSQLVQSSTRYFPQLAFASVFAISAWVAFDKGIIIQPRGAMMFFLVAALPGICANLRIAEGLEASDSHATAKPE